MKLADLLNQKVFPLATTVTHNSKYSKAEEYSRLHLTGQKLECSGRSCILIAFGTLPVSWGELYLSWQFYQ